MGCSSTAASATWTSAPYAASSSPSAATPFPSSATWTLPPVRFAISRPAASAWRVALRRWPWACSATMRTLDMFSLRARALEDLRLLVELLPELVDVGDLDAALPLRRLLELLHHHLRREVDAERRRRQLLHRLLLRLHDPGEGREARLVQAEVRGDHRGQPHLERLDAAVHLADDRQRLAVRAEHETGHLLLLRLALEALRLGRERRLREA